jgi:hypothetical protein
MVNPCIDIAQQLMIVFVGGVDLYCFVNGQFGIVIVFLDVQADCKVVMSLIILIVAA